MTPGPDAALEQLVAAACDGEVDVDAFAGLLHDVDRTFRLPPLQCDHRGVWHVAPATCAWAPATPPWSRLDGWDASTGRPCLRCLVGDDTAGPTDRETVLRAVQARAVHADPHRQLRPWRILDALADLDAATGSDRPDADIVRHVRARLAARLTGVPGDAVVAAALAWRSGSGTDPAEAGTRRLVADRSGYRLVAALLPLPGAVLPTFGPLCLWRGYGRGRPGVHVLAAGPAALTDLPGVADLDHGTAASGVAVAAGQLWADADDDALYSDPRAAWQAARHLAVRQDLP